MYYEQLPFDKCVYCGESWEHWDHVFPYSRGQYIEKGFISFLVPSCAECNWIARDYVAKTFRQKADFIKTKLEFRYRKRGGKRLERRLSYRVGGLDELSTLIRVSDERVITKLYKDKRKNTTRMLNFDREKVCCWCGRNFSPLRSYRKFCSSSCSLAWESHYNEDPLEFEVGEYE